MTPQSPAPTAVQMPIGLAKAILFVLCLLPAGRLLWAAQIGDFGPNPVEFVQRWTGTWTLNLLVLTLCITPLRTLSGWHWLLRLRRMLGLFTFFYAALHMLSWLGFDHGFDVTEMALDVLKRPFILVGALAFLLLIPLAATSSNLAIRRLGGRRWQSLHRSTYLIAILACLHYFWLVKATALLWPIGYSLIMAALLGWRIRERRRKAIPVPRPPAQAIPLRFHAQRPEQRH